MLHLPLMLSFFKKYRLFWIGLLGFSLIMISIFYTLLKPKVVLPIYQPNGVNVALVDSSIQHQKKYHKIANFSLSNQNGELITQDYYKGKIYIADFFFTTCQTICPIMTDHMYQIQKKLKNDDDILLLSHTVLSLIHISEPTRPY